MRTFTVSPEYLRNDFRKTDKKLILLKLKKQKPLKWLK